MLYFSNHMIGSIHVWRGPSKKNKIKSFSSSFPTIKIRTAFFIEKLKIELKKPKLKREITKLDQTEPVKIGNQNKTDTATVNDLSQFGLTELNWFFLICKNTNFGSQKVGYQFISGLGAVSILVISNFSVRFGI